MRSFQLKNLWQRLLVVTICYEAAPIELAQWRIAAWIEQAHEITKTQRHHPRAG